MNSLAVAQEVSNAAGISNPARNYQSTIRVGNLVVEIKTCVVEADGSPVWLTGKEYSIVELLSLRHGTIVTKEMFLGHLYGGMNKPRLKIIDVFVCKLRKKLAHATGGKQYIKTVWGRGYRLCDPAEIPSQPILNQGPQRERFLLPRREATVDSVKGPLPQYPATTRSLRKRSSA